jgi:hypothetical protein
MFIAARGDIWREQNRPKTAVAFVAVYNAICPFFVGQLFHIAAFFSRVTPLPTAPLTALLTASFLICKSWPENHTRKFDKVHTK